MAKEHGFDNINMDLIVGLPNEGKSDLAYSLDEIKKLQARIFNCSYVSFQT